MLDLAIVVVSWNTAALLRTCLQSVLASCPEGLRQVIVVDNGSTDGSGEMVAIEYPTVTLIRNSQNAGFARASNQGMAASHSRYVMLLNSDTRIPSGALGRLVAFMEEHIEVGACSPRLVREDGSAQPFAFGQDPTLDYLLRRAFSSIVWRRPLHDWGTDLTQTVDWVTGACLLTRREVVDSVGGLDEGFFMYFEDNDWCLRMRRAGWQVVFYPAVQVVHLGGQSLAQNPAARAAYHRSLEYFYAKHYGTAACLALQPLLALYRRLPVTR